MTAPTPEYLSEFSSLYAEFTEGAFLKVHRVRSLELEAQNEYHNECSQQRLYTLTFSNVFKEFGKI